nr:putative ribonuclease H-like domain-containing protein [Tanacetum cinerariifolium]
MDQQNPTLAKIPILDTGKFKQWQFRIQQYLQHEHYALWEVIEFGDSYEAPTIVAATGSASEGTATKKGRTVALTTEDMQKRKNDTFNRLQAIVMDIEIEQDDLNQKFLTSLAPEWLMHTIKKSESNSQNMAFISSAKNNSRKEDVNTASIPTANTNVSPASLNIRVVSIIQDTACAYIASQSRTDVVGFDKLKVECFNCHKMGHFTRECRAPRSQDRGRRDHYRQGSKVEEQAPKALMAIDGVGWDWSFMGNEEEDHALVVDEEAPTEFALMAKTSAESEVEGRLVEFKNQEIKFCEKIRVLVFSVECKTNQIENLTNELELLKKEKEGLESKLTGFQSALKELDSLLESKRLDKKKERPSPAIESTFDDAQNRNPSVPETDASPSTISSKPFIKFVKAADPSTVAKSDKKESNISYLTDYEPYDGGTPRQHNMYTIDLNNIIPHKDLTCLVAKASADESMSWHMRLGHLNFKTMNRLARHNLVRGLPSKSFDNDHTCAGCLKGKQHKASCKTKLVNSVTKPLHTLHMDLFGPTFVSSLNHKWYCLVVTDDFSRFTWTFFLKTKDETSGIPRNFLTEIENLKELRVKIIRVLVNKSQNKTPYELFNGRTPAIGFLKPFGSYVMILNTLDNLGKFEAKGDEGYFIGYSMSSKAFRVQILLTFQAHLESSTSNAQDTFSADAPESNGNSNLTATSTNPSANHMETLAVETLIPTVSSPVLTACLNNSPKPLSDTRLIFKRVTSQDDTPSLDNILSLTNRIEAIRLFLAYASFMGFTVYQMDVKSAFLYDTINEEVYVMQPPGF